MFAYTGIVSRVVVSDWLVLALAGPALALAWALWGVLMEDDAKREAREASARWACVAGSLAGLVGLAWQAWGVGPDAVAVQHLLRLVRVGQLDVSIDLALDATSAAMAAAILAASAAFFGARERVAARLAVAGNLVVIGATLAVMADGALASVLGASVAGVALVGASGERPAVAPRIADALVVAGVAALFWVQGGSWSAERYVPDVAAPRVIAVTDAKPDAKTDARADDARSRERLTGSAALTFDALPGALVYLDESRAPLADKGGAALRAPFAGVPVPAGLHTLRVRPGVGLDDYVVERVLFEPNAKVRLTTLGPTVVYRQAADQLAVSPERGAIPRERLRGRGVMIAIATALLALGALLRASTERAQGLRTLAAIAALPPAIVAVRFAPLVALFAWAQGVMAVLGAVAAVVAAARAARATTWDALGAALGLGAVGAALAGAALGARGAAVASLATGVLAIATLAEAHRRADAVDDKPVSGLRRVASGLASAALSGAPAPVVAGAWVAIGCYAPAVTTAPAALAAVVVACGAAHAGLASFAVWRAHLLGASEKERAKEPIGARGLVVLGGVALVLGAALAFAPRLFGGEGEGPLSGSLGGTPKGTTPTAAAALVVFGAALFGWSAARKRYGAGRAKDWRTREQAALARVTAIASIGVAPVGALGGLASGLARLAAALEEHVFDFAPRAVLAVVGASGWVGAAVERDATLDAGARAARRGGGRVIAVLVVLCALAATTGFVMRWAR